MECTILSLCRRFISFRTCSMFQVPTLTRSFFLSTNIKIKIITIIIIMKQWPCRECRHVILIMKIFLNFIKIFNLFREKGKEKSKMTILHFWCETGYIEMKRWSYATDSVTIFESYQTRYEDNSISRRWSLLRWKMRYFCPMSNVHHTDIEFNNDFNRIGLNL